MRVFDFDQTIYKGDSTRDFYFYCLLRYPRILLCLPAQLGHFILYLLGIHRKTAFKERFYRFFRYIPDMEAAVSDFWGSHFSHIKAWYLSDIRESDVVVSASPDFLLRIPCEKLGIRKPIASLADIKTGRYTGENCYGEEKPLRFRALYPDQKIESFYSDSLSDAPLAALAEKSFIVRGEELIPWSDYRPGFIKRFFKTFFSPDFFRFALVGAFNTLSCTFLSAFLSLFIPEAVIAFAGGYIFSLIIAFFLNSLFTFRKRLCLRRFPKFVLSYVPNFLCQLFSVWILCDLLSLPRIFSFLLSALCAFPLTFILMKLFAFRK